MGEKALDDVIRKTILNPQSGVRSVVYNVVEKVVLDMLRELVIKETLGAHIAKYLEIAAAAGGLLKRLLTSSSLMAPTATLNRRKTDTAMKKIRSTVSPLRRKS